MPSYVMLLAPSSNRVYAGATGELATAELRATWPDATEVEAVQLAGVDYLAFDADPEALPTIARQSACFALFERDDELLRPVELPGVFALDDDIVTIPRYQGKTNEQFTQLLLGVTLAAITREPDGNRQILDPLAGRGTTISTALRLGHDAYGVELDEKAFEAMSAFYKTYFRRKRMKHTADVTAVKRNGRAVGRRFDLRVNDNQATVFTGDATRSAALFGKKRFDAVVTDAPYGVAHGATAGGEKDRSPAKLLADAIPVWAGQLKHGGALGLSWNTFGIARDDLAAICERAGLTPWPASEGFAHRVDSSIKRDLFVALKP
ncbi:MAG: site-specific DNA-methyltransferase [Propionibacterium sp.]|nr:site-specific DNA-methyltransferase [Propionibacterium sp.]